MERIKTSEEIRFEKATKRVNQIKGYYKHLITYILVNSALILIKYYHLEPQETFLEFSTFSTAFFWGIGLFFHTLNVFTKNIFLGPDWEEKKINQYMNQNKNTKWE